MMSTRSSSFFRFYQYLVLILNFPFLGYSVKQKVKQRLLILSPFFRYFCYNVKVTRDCAFHRPFYRANPNKYAFFASRKWAYLNKNHYRFCHLGAKVILLF